MQCGWVSLLLTAALVVAGCGAVDDASSREAAGSGLAVASTAKVNNQGRGLDVGNLAPEFVLKHADGETSNLSDWLGQPVIMNFWASWCAPCKEEMPALIDAYRAHEADGLVVLGVNAQESAEQAKTFVDKFQMPFPVALDSRGEVMQLYMVRGLPTTIFIDREGRIAMRYAGLLTEELLDEFVAKIK